MSNQELRLLIKNELEYLKFLSLYSSQNYKNVYKEHQEIIDANIKFLDDNSNPSEKLFCYLNNITEIQKCQYCNDNKVKFNSYSEGYSIYCSSKCSNRSEHKMEKARQTTLKNYGVEYPAQSKKVQNKMKQTNLKNNGVENPSQCIEIKNKKIETSRKNFNCDYPTQSQLIKDKTNKTNNNLYNADWPMQNAEIFERSQKKRFKMKDYTMPSGDIRTVQGYENYALDILLKTYKENDIVTSATKIPKIIYEFEDDNHRSYPDIFILSENRFIEVKCDYTFNVDKEVNILKQKASINNGYRHDIWIIDDKGKLIEVV